MASMRENYLKAVRFERPDFIPMTFHINPACYEAYDHDFLFEQMERHPLLFPDFKRPAEPYVFPYSGNCVAGRDYVDGFGCVWRTSANGITGTVVGHPLEDWEDYKTYVFPDPEKSNGLGPVSWEKTAANIAAARAEGRLVLGSLRHGHTFLQLCDLRGYENLLFDMVDEEPLLMDLIEKLEAFNRCLVEKYVALGVDVMAYPEDLGMQIGPMLSPEQFRQYIKPSYQRLIAPAREKGIIIHMHSDGSIQSLAEDLVEGGVEILNLQDLVNGIEWIRDQYRGRVCIELDIDRQQITPFGTPEQVDDLIRREVTELGSREGGLMMIYGLYPGVPEKNVVALMDAMERYADMY